MDVTPFAPWVAAAIALIALVRSFASDRSKAIAEKLRLLYDRVDSVEDRSTRIETQLKELPVKDTTHRLEVMMLELGSEVRVLGERIKPVAAVSERLQEFLFERVERTQR